MSRPMEWAEPPKQLSVRLDSQTWELLRPLLSEMRISPSLYLEQLIKADLSIFYGAEQGGSDEPF